MSTTLPKSQANPITLLRQMAEDRTNPERGRRIEELMDRSGWTPAPLGRAMRVDRGLIYGWKAGKPISSDHLERLAVALETTRHYIQTGEGDAHYPRGLPPLLYLKQLAEEREAEDS